MSKKNCLLKGVIPMKDAIEGEKMPARSSEEDNRKMVYLLKSVIPVKTGIQ